MKNSSGLSIGHSNPVLLRARVASSPRLCLATLPIGASRTFPQKTWLLAGILSLVAFGAIMIAQRLNAETKQKIFYHRAYHAVHGFQGRASSGDVGQLGGPRGHPRLHPASGE